MHSEAVIRAVEKLLNDESLSYRAIAQLLRVSRGTVAAIARGEIVVPQPADADEPWATGPIERCPTCGGMVYLPCRLCKVRTALQRSRADRRAKADIAEALLMRRLHPHVPTQPARDRLSGKTW